MARAEISAAKQKAAGQAVPERAEWLRRLPAWQLGLGLLAGHLVVVLQAGPLPAESRTRPPRHSSSTEEAWGAQSRKRVMARRPHPSRAVRSGSYRC